MIGYWQVATIIILTTTLDLPAPSGRIEHVMV
jgi:hypothetical protein